MSTSRLLASAAGLRLRDLSLSDDLSLLGEFNHALRTEPRYFGPGSHPKLTSRRLGQLLHPAGEPPVAALCDRRIVGVARVVPKRSGGGDLLVAVLPEWRRAGIGSRLVRTVIDSNVARSLEPITFESDPRCLGAEGLARRFGFVLDGHSDPTAATDPLVVGMRQWRIPSPSPVLRRSA
jgi:GNAT superfamily N-acetyltransferase